MKIYPDPDCIRIGGYHDAFAVAGPTPQVSAAQFAANLRRYHREAGQLPATTIMGCFPFDTPPFRAPVELMDVAWDRGIVPQVILWPYGVCDLASILAGAWDADLRRCAGEMWVWTQGGRRPLILQWCTEVNLWLYPWGAPQNGGFAPSLLGDQPWPLGPKRYVEAYRHVHDLFTNEGVECNWHFQGFHNWTGEPLNHLRYYFPGPAYADSIGVGIMLEPVPGSVYATFESGWSRSVQEVDEVPGAEHLPFYGEFTCKEYGGSPNLKAQFWNDVFSRAFSGEWPRVNKNGATAGFWLSNEALEHDDSALRSAGPRPLPKYAPLTTRALGRSALGVNAQLGLATSAESAAAFRACSGTEWFTNK